MYSTVYRQVYRITADVAKAIAVWLIQNAGRVTFSNRFGIARHMTVEIVYVCFWEKIGFYVTRGMQLPAQGC